MPTVTVLMPAYNAGKFIGESIRSVLAQSYSHWELLIVNDGSSDNTVDVVKSFNDPRIRLVENPQNMGLIKTLNRGLAEAQGEWIARLDADDLASPDRIALQMDAFEHNADLALLGGRSHIIDENGGVKKNGAAEYQPESPIAVRWACVFFKPFRHSAVMFKRSVVWDEIGGYPEDAKDIEDYALWSKVVAKYDAANLPEVLCEYRVHSDSILANARAQNAVMQDPRRLCAEPYFRASAEAAGVPLSAAIQWGQLWPNIRFNQVGSRRELEEIHGALGAILSFEPVGNESRCEARAVSAAAYYKLYRVVRAQSGLHLRLHVLIRGLQFCGSSLLQLFAASTFRRLRRKFLV